MKCIHKNPPFAVLITLYAKGGIFRSFPLLLFHLNGNLLVRDLNLFRVERQLDLF